MTERLRNSISGVLSMASSVVSTRVCAGGRMQLSETLWATAHQAPLSMPFIPGKDTREGCHFLLQGIFLAQGLSPHPCIPCIGGWILYLGSPCRRPERKLKSLSRVRLFVAPWTIAYQAPPSMGFSRQEYWSGLAISFSRGSSRPRDRTRVSRAADGCFAL